MVLERLKTLRIKKNLSQNDMAESLQIPVTTYRSYEQGKREPNHDTLVKISNILNVTTDYLLGREASFPTTDSMPDTFSKLPTDIQNDITNLMQHILNNKG